MEAKANMICEDMYNIFIDTTFSRKWTLTPLSDIACMGKPTSGVHLSNLLHSIVQEVEGHSLLPTFHSQLKLNSMLVNECLAG